MNKKGTAYIYLVIVITAIAVMLSVVVGIAAYQAKVTAAHSIRAGMYEICASSIENAVKTLNEALMLRYDSLCNNIVDSLTELDGRIMYSAGHDPYDGEFHLKTPDSGSVLGKNDRYFEALFIEQVKSIEDIIFDECFEKMVNPYTGNVERMISYCIGTGAERDDKYYITVWITRKEPNLWSFTANVSLNGIAAKDAVFTASAQVSISPEAHEEVVIPRYQWRDGIQPVHFGFAVYACGQIITDSASEPANTLINAPLGFDEVTDSSVWIDERDWTEHDAVVITDSSGDYMINVGSFRDGVDPVRTVIINKGAGRLLLTGGEFYGVIISRGEVWLYGAQVYGSIISGANIVLDATSSVQYIDGLPFSARISDRQLFKKLSDYLRITDFKSAEGEVRDIGSILKNAELSDGFSVAVSNFDVFSYRIVKLQQNYLK